MKKLFSFVLSAGILLGLTACGNQVGEPNASKGGVERAGNGIHKVTLVVNGNLGDLGFFDSAAEGLKRLKNEKGIEYQIIETGAEEAKWEPALADAAEEETDIVIAVSPSMVEPIEKIAPQYPEKKFFLIDNAVNFAKANLKNVYCATFKQNEGSFLAGAAAALKVQQSSKKLGFLGGQDIPPINDFLVGFIQGALYVEPQTKIAVAYAGDYYNPAKGKELGLVLFQQGADLIFPAAGPTGLGTIEAAVQSNKNIIGVDNDQSSLYSKNGDTKSAEAIITSMMKNIGDSIYRAVVQAQEGTLEFGRAEALGFAEGGISLAKNAVYQKAFTAEQQKEIEAIQKKIESGEIHVDTAIGMSDADLKAWKDKVAP